jgi:signal transduction histidine kinase
MKFDVTTMAVVGTLLQVIQALILMHTWRTRTTYPGFGDWFAGTVCWFLGGIFTLFFQNMQPQFIPQVIGLGLLLMMPVFFSEGLRRFHCLPPRWWDLRFSLALVGVTLGLQMHFIYAGHDMRSRLIMRNAVMAILFSGIALKPLLYPFLRRYSMQWLLSLVIVPLVALFAARVWWYASPISATFNVTRWFHEDILLRWLLLQTIVVQLVINYSYLSMTSDRVEEDLRISEGNLRELSNSLQLRVDEEIGHRLAQERIMATQARLAAMGEMVGAIAHQWRQPLSALGMMVQRHHAVGVRQGITPDMLNDFKVGAMGQIRHMSDTIEEFRGFFRTEKDRVFFSPLACINDAFRLFEPQFTSHGITVSVKNHDGADGTVSGFPNEFKHVILNLVNNARDAILELRAGCGEPDEGWITVEISTLLRTMIIDISDNGGGVPPELAPHLFEPYVTTKVASGGSGIGLYLARMIIQESLGGSIQLVSDAGGATFRIELPLESIL